MFPSTSSRGKVGLSGKQNQLLPLPFSVYCIKLRGALAGYFNSLPAKVTDLERHDPCIFFINSPYNGARIAHSRYIEVLSLH